MKSIYTIVSSSRRRRVLIWTGIGLWLSILVGCGTLVGCGPSAEELKAVVYTPRDRADWPVSTPAAEGLDPLLVARLYYNAAKLKSLYGVLVIKNDTLIAEKYFNIGYIDQVSGRMSFTKSVTSALIGLALEQGYLKNLDQKMIDFFPEYAELITDPRKKQITIRQLLMMRSGYPWEEHYPDLTRRMFWVDDWRWLPHIVDVPLDSDPGTRFGYSNLGSHLLGVIAARATHLDLMVYAQKNLFTPIGATIADWTQDEDGYRWGFWEIQLTARDMAKFGKLYMHGGRWDGTQVIPEAWVKDSLIRYSEGINFTAWIGSGLGGYMHDLGYGYQWWSATAGRHTYDFAWGHGGQLVVLLHDLDMMIVTTADPLYGVPGEESWHYEGAIIDLVGEFIASLP